MDAERWKRVDDLLQSALQLQDGQQEEFLRHNVVAIWNCWKKFARC